MLITIKKTETKEQTVDVQLPAYYQWGRTKYKILNEVTAIEVQDWEASFGIRVADTLEFVLPELIIKGVRITEKEFVEAFERVGEKVKRELIKAIESDAWKQQEQNELKANALAEIL
jgi:hypothetical protein